MPKPHGHLGPNPCAPDNTSELTATLLLSMMIPVMMMMAQNMATSMSKSSRHLTPPSSPICQYSPPPPIEDELTVFLDAFSHAKNISSSVLSTAQEQLCDAHYTPDVIHEASVSVHCLQELTGLAEGEVYSLKKFSWEWCGKVKAKRAKRRH